MRVVDPLLVPLLPPWALATALHPRWRVGWRARWGLDVPPVAPGAIWIHAASVGEIGAAMAVVAHLPDPVLVTADTDTGVAHARRLAAGRPGVAVGPKPVDHPLTLAPLWAEARPRIVVFVEGTSWPALAALARGAGVPVVRISGTMGVRTRRLAPGWPQADAVLARDAEHAARFRGPVTVGGDPKADRPVPPPILRWSRPFAVAASLRAGDTERVLAALPPGLGLLLAPRHPERFEPRLLDGRRWVRRTALGAEVPPDIDIVLLDTVGELAGGFAGAVWAFVGGTFDPALGGHSPLEAAAAGVPVVAGPEIGSHREAFLAANASIDADLATAIRAARPPPPLVAGAAERSARWTLAHAGPPAPEASPRPWARPLSVAVALGAGLRNFGYDSGLRSIVAIGIPVVSVGSTNARSPGRTSTVRALVAALAARGHVVGVALRGYRRTGGGRGVHLSSDVRWIGDEGAVLVAAGARVAAGPDRVEGARRLRDAGATVVLLDDGLAARGLHRDLDIAVIDARFPGARGLLPAGERRETTFVPDRVDLVLVHHGDGRFGFPGEPATRRPGPWSRIPEGPVAAVSGIGRPADFLASLDVPVARFLALPDHAPFDPATTERILRWADGLPIVCTGKDAVRMPERLRRRAFWRDVEVGLPEALLARLPERR